MSEKDWSGKGPEFMALRANVRAVRRKHRKDLTPLQNYLLDDITEGTANTWSSEAEFNLDELAAGLEVKLNKVYSTLKILHAREFITRKPSPRGKRLEILGLNDAVFGQVLIDYQNNLEKRKHLKMVVNNPASLVPKKDHSSPKSGPIKSQIRTESVLNRDQISQNTSEIIEENGALDSNRLLIDSFRCEIPQQSCSGKGFNYAGQNVIDEAMKNFRKMPKK